MYVDDETRLLVMRDATREALEFVEGCTRTQFTADPLRRRAVAACLTELGEAASRLTPQARAELRHALTPDTEEVSMRLVNGEYHIDPALLWSVVTEQLPSLRIALEDAVVSPALVGASSGGGASRVVTLPIAIDPSRVASLCEEHSIRWLALFGSVLRQDFGPDSDVDVLVEFEPETRVSLLDMVALERQLTDLLGRQVDLQTPGDLSRYFRQRVLDSAEVLYVRR